MIKAFGDTMLGGRKNNEDSFWPQSEFDQHILFAVADGMGGQQAGEVASRMVIEAMEELEAKILEEGDAALDVEALLTETVMKVNGAICEESDMNPAHRGLATTLTAVVIRDEGRFHYVHLGDTRLYRLQTQAATDANGQADTEWASTRCRRATLTKELEVLTKDHTVAHLMLRRGHITQEDYDDSPMKHSLTSRVGMDEGIEIDTGSEELAPGDRLLICSDGLWDALTEDELKQALVEATDPQQAVERLLALAEQKQTEDNATAMVVFAT